MNDKTMSGLRGKPTDLRSVGIIAARLLSTSRANLSTAQTYPRSTSPPSQREPTDDEEQLGPDDILPPTWRHTGEDEGTDGSSVETLLAWLHNQEVSVPIVQEDTAPFPTIWDSLDGEKRQDHEKRLEFLNTITYSIAIISNSGPASNLDKVNQYLIADTLEEILWSRLDEFPSL